MSKKEEIQLNLKAIISSLPQQPGIYQYFDSKEDIIYIGKAKNLKKRVASYFNKKHEDAKTRILVRKINNIKYVVVDSEIDALLLENNLIKKYKPRYNILLKDDKSYPWICVKKEPFPRVFYTRKYIKDGSKYYGPYTSIQLVKTLIDLFRQLYRFRTCNYDLTQKKIDAKRYKACLKHHIKKCDAPCIGGIGEDIYDNYISNVKHILNGNISQVIKHLNELMTNLANKYKFEEAQQLKEQVLLLKNYQKKSTVVSPVINNVDVFSIVEDSKNAFINYFKVVNGSIIQTHTVEIVKKLDETEEELLLYAITNIRERFNSTSKEIILPVKPKIELPGIKFTVPLKGDKKHLLDLSHKNAKYYRIEKLKQYEHLNPQKHTDRILNTIKTDLKLEELPKHIECFDNSNFQGAYPVSACVVFRDAKAYKKDYRHYNVKTVVGANDFATMEEVIYRRYKRLVEENKSLPQLIVVDGGKGQLGAAVNSLTKLNLLEKIKVIGIAKRLEEIFFPGDPIPLYLNKNSESLKIIQQLRDEAHRFGITFHRKKRLKGTIKSELEEITGIGKKTAEVLLEKIGSVKRIKEAELELLENAIGKSKAKITHEYFHK